MKMNHDHIFPIGAEVLFMQSRDNLRAECEKLFHEDFHVDSKSTKLHKRAFILKETKNQ